MMVRQVYYCRVYARGGQSWGIRRRVNPLTVCFIVALAMVALFVWYVSNAPAVNVTALAGL